MTVNLEGKNARKRPKKDSVLNRSFMNDPQTHILLQQVIKLIDVFLCFCCVENARAYESLGHVK